MKKNIILVVFALMSFAFSAEAQSCCSSKEKSKTSTDIKVVNIGTTTESDGSESTVIPDLISETDTTEKFTVYGNCGMCKKTIEKSLKEVEGISKGEWDKETHVMTVTFDPDVINVDDIKQKIADVGYDSDSHRATEEVYNSLPGCCQYERPTN